MSVKILKNGIDLDLAGLHAPKRARQAMLRFGDKTQLFSNTENIFNVISLAFVTVISMLAVALILGCAAAAFMLALALVM